MPANSVNPTQWFMRNARKHPSRVRVDGGVVSDRGLKLDAGTYVVQVGKRKFARVNLA